MGTRADLTLTRCCVLRPCLARAQCVSAQLIETMQRHTILASRASSDHGSNFLYPQTLPNSTVLVGEDPSVEAVVDDSSRSPESRLSNSLWSGCGWHINGNPFAEHTPLAQCTARSQAREHHERAGLEAFREDASNTLHHMLSAASNDGSNGKVHMIQPAVATHEAPHLSSFRSCNARGGDPGVIFALGIISAPAHLAHRSAIRFLQDAPMPNSARCRRVILSHVTSHCNPYCWAVPQTNMALSPQQVSEPHCDQVLCRRSAQQEFSHCSE